MTKKITSALLAFVMLAACQKTDNTTSTNSLAVKTPGEQISAAKLFFTNYIIKSPSLLASIDPKIFTRQQVNKTPLWDKAFIINDKVKGDIVTVPIQYEKSLHFKTNFGNENTLSLANQSNLLIYKDISGKYSAVVSITLPDKTQQNIKSKAFSGYVLEEDWAGNTLSMHLYKNQKVYKLAKSTLVRNIPQNITSVTNKSIIECDAIDWYECENIDQYGVGTNCQYLYTEYVNCEVIGDDGGGGGSGGGGGGGYGDPIPIVNINGSSSVTENDVDDAGAPAITYSHTYTLQLVNNEVVNVIRYPVTASPMISSYIDRYGRNTTRTLTLLAQGGSWTPLTGTSGQINWICDVFAVYVYSNGNPTYAKQWTHTHSVIY